MKQGQTEKLVIQTCIKRGQPLPEVYQNAPTLFFGLAHYYNAFWELTTDRQIGMGIGPIPWSSLDRYAQREGMSDDEFERFCYLIRVMDDAYIKHVSPPKDA